MSARLAVDRVVPYCDVALGNGKLPFLESIRAPRGVSTVLLIAENWHTTIDAIRIKLHPGRVHRRSMTIRRQVILLRTEWRCGSGPRRGAHSARGSKAWST